MITNHHQNYIHSRNNLVKSNSYHGNVPYHRKSLADTSQPNYMVLPSPMNRISRASTMSTIMEKQHPPRTITPPPQQNNRNKKRNSSNSNRISASNLMEDDIPLALLAYKKGYTNMSPSNSSTANVDNSSRPLSSSNIHSTHSQLSDKLLVKKKKHRQQQQQLHQQQPPTKRKKKHVPYQIKTNTESNTSQSSTVVSTPTIIEKKEQPRKKKKKMSFNKNWFSSLRKLLSISSKK
ncbi:hypothetical protein INT46_011383 [Mucor plumbeus]|uniref:Uncharacterized protein n=1 Tax=Mucor plumbeus TaxID=97098 RepID=A0A8H7UXL2_9FUNG|nr:hypothetical protein INT46_011383 [Mucor plumbeus]